MRYKELLRSSISSSLFISQISKIQQQETEQAPERGLTWQVFLQNSLAEASVCGWGQRFSDVGGRTSGSEVSPCWIPKDVVCFQRGKAYDLTKHRIPTDVLRLSVTYNQIDSHKKRLLTTDG